MTLDFFVAGTPAGQGSMKAFRAGKVANAPIIMQHSNKATLLPWRETIGNTARAAGATMVSGPVGVSLTFSLTRPTGQFRKDGTLKPSAAAFPVAKNRDDIDKLARAVLDALTNVCWIDDSQVVALRVKKDFSPHLSPCGVLVRVWEY